MMALLSTLTTVLRGQDTTRLRVGVVERAPYAMRDERGNWSGLSVELWRQVAERESVTYELVRVAERDSLLPLVGRTVDVLLRAPITPNGTYEVDYLHQYQETSLAVAKPQRNSIWRVVSNLFSRQFLYIVLSLSGLLIIIGTAIYFLERGQNEDQFGGDRSLLEGIGSGFWWAGVTLTTIGYGDKAPQTLGGRIVAMLWMLTALAITASLTAAVVSALSGQGKLSFPDDLRDKRIGAVTHSQASDFLESKDISYRSFGNATDGLRELSREELDYFVGNATELEYALKDDDGLAADLQPTDVRPQGYAIAVERGSPLRDRFDAAAISAILSEDWRKARERYGASR